MPLPGHNPLPLAPDQQLIEQSGTTVQLVQIGVQRAQAQAELTFPLLASFQPTDQLASLNQNDRRVHRLDQTIRILIPNGVQPAYGLYNNHQLIERHTLIKTTKPIPTTTSIDAVQ